MGRHKIFCAFDSQFNVLVKLFFKKWFNLFLHGPKY
jgi:hypothetical protein